MQLKDNDLSYIVRHIPSDLRDMMQKNGGDTGIKIGGGFIRAIIAGEKISDIDIFGSSKDQLKVIASECAFNRGCKVHESANAITLLSPPRWPVQFITRWSFDSPESCMSSFDFTIAQAVIWYEPIISDEDRKERRPHWRSFCHPDFYSDLAAHRLVYTYPQRD